MNPTRQHYRIPTVAALAVLMIALLFGSSHAQYFQFGKNRVKYNEFKWRFIQSDHFDIHYYGSLNYELADFTARTLESSLRQLSEDYDHNINNRIKVIIYDSHNDFSQTNVVSLPTNSEGIGGVTDLFKNRITMPFNGNYAEYRSTLQHELTHAVINDMYYGGSIQNLISNNVQLVFPNWFDEGLAEYTSIGWDTNTDMFIRDAIINDYLPPIPRLGGYFAYRGGQSMWNFIVEEYGREKIGEIMQIIKSQRSVQAGFRRGLGLSVEELSKRWTEYYKQRYFPEIAEREDISNIGTLITERSKAGTYNTSPAISPQGDKIAMITNARGFMDVVVISAVTGNKLKTLIKGGDNVNFEELNILNPNLSWSPDGDKLTLSAKSKGSDDLAIVDYATGKIQKIKFPRLDAIGSVAWSPDGKKIAFDGNIGPYQDIFVYNLETQQFINLTNDVFSDYEPSWSSDSEQVYFVSARGDKVQLNTFKANYRLLLDDDMYSTDIYAVRPGDREAVRLTKTPEWNERQPATTRDGKLVYISDQNGIPNIYRINLEDRTSVPLTNLRSGVLQMSISADGSRLAVNSVNEGFLDIFMIRSPFLRDIGTELKPNEWAQRRANESLGERVPAVRYVREMFSQATPKGISGEMNSDLALAADVSPPDQAQAGNQQETAQDTSKTEQKKKEEEKKKEEDIDFRNYVFAEEVEEDSAFVNKYLDPTKFDPINNMTDDGRYQPRKYRLRFTTDFIYAGGTFSTYGGTGGLTQIVFSDLLGNHQIAFGTNLVTDLRNSDYFLQYGYLENRTNYLFNVFHSSANFQSFSGELLRFRTLGAGVTAQYPIDQFRRLDYGLSFLQVSQDFSIVGFDQVDNRSSGFLFPRVTFTSDHTLPGFITPRAGSRYALSLTGSPPITGETLRFVSLLGDYRKYFNLGRGYTFAVRGSGAASFGRDSQTYFMGGMLGWINQEWSGNSIPRDRLTDTFFTTPALPLRGHELNEINGDKFTLINAEFRFPLFAAVLPGPIPFLPLYNITGVAFVDAGTAWGIDIPFQRRDVTGQPIEFIINEKDLNFKLAEEQTYFVNLVTREVAVGQPPAGSPDEIVSFDSVEGDVLMGAGFGLRTILLGFPLRYDVGWPYFRDGFKGDPIHYISIGIDF
ncbi:MAG: hypothetical protein R3211_02570 [Balneolaceae bacterium]|nr:hypothetical protein [Balneolaceae bacterium]